MYADLARLTSRDTNFQGVLKKQRGWDFRTANQTKIALSAQEKGTLRKLV